jgi:hypothetical protein
MNIDEEPSAGTGEALPAPLLLLLVDTPVKVAAAPAEDGGAP